MSVNVVFEIYRCEEGHAHGGETTSACCEALFAAIRNQSLAIQTHANTPVGAADVVFMPTPRTISDVLTQALTGTRPLAKRETPFKVCPFCAQPINALVVESRKPHKKGDA